MTGCSGDFDCSSDQSFVLTLGKRLARAALASCDDYFTWQVRGDPCYYGSTENRSGGLARHTCCQIAEMCEIWLVLRVTTECRLCNGFERRLGRP